MSKGESLNGTGDPLLNRLMTGDLDAVGKMSEEVEDDHKTVLEIVERMKKVQEKAFLGRTDGELAQDREALRLSKSEMGTLDTRTHSRDKLRKAGMTLQLFKTICEVRELKREEALRGLEEPEGEIDGNKNKRVMGFGGISSFGL